MPRRTDVVTRLACMSNAELDELPDEPPRPEAPRLDDGGPSSFRGWGLEPWPSPDRHLSGFCPTGVVSLVLSPKVAAGLSSGPVSAGPESGLGAGATPFDARPLGTRAPSALRPRRAPLGGH